MTTICIAFYEQRFNEDMQRSRRFDPALSMQLDDIEDLKQRVRDLEAQARESIAMSVMRHGGAAGKA